MTTQLQTEAPGAFHGERIEARADRRRNLERARVAQKIGPRADEFARHRGAIRRENDDEIARATGAGDFKASLVRTTRDVINYGLRIRRRQAGHAWAQAIAPARVLLIARRERHLRSKRRGAGAHIVLGQGRRRNRKQSGGGSGEIHDPSHFSESSQSR